ncbi:transmembrane protein 177-like [Panonychus citri]|uniref:transmembrane protein 177-like n=1 Tax=Panonychus citri TaxID=50023 RepID=UPI0023079BE2|nr:transmembrane protein 177-like [Panonychus citri]
MYSTRAPKPSWSKLKIFTVGLTTGCVASYNPIKNTMGINYSVKKVSLISDNNKMVQIPLSLLEFADDVRLEVKIKEQAKSELKFFLTKELDVVSVGNLNLTNGAKIGIPYTYIYDKVEDVDPKVVESLIGVDKLTQGDWHSTKNGQNLINSLVLSKEAKKFAIARGIMIADSEMVMYKDVLHFAGIFGAFATYNYLEPRAIGVIGKVPTIIGLGTLLVVGFISVAVILSDYIDQICAQSCDSRAIENPKETYANGAIEYYEKLIERNKSLRGLLINGPEKFDSDGNPIPWYQINFSSLQESLDKCKKLIDRWVADSATI